MSTYITVVSVSLPLPLILPFSLSFTVFSPSPPLSHTHSQNYHHPAFHRNLRLYQYFSVSTAAMKHCDQRQLGGERLHFLKLSGHTPSLREVRPGTLEAGTEAEAMKDAAY